MEDIIRIQEQVKTLFNNQGRLDDEQQKHEAEDRETFSEIRSEIRKITDGMVPNWVARAFGWGGGVIGVLVTIAVGLVVLVVRGVGG